MPKIISNVENMMDRETRDFGYFEIEKSANEYRVDLEDRYVYVPDLDIRIHYGHGMGYNSDTEEYDELLDDIYSIFDINKDKFVYEREQSTILECISEYLSSINNNNYTLSDINNLGCEIKYL